MASAAGPSSPSVHRIYEPQCKPSNRSALHSLPSPSTLPNLNPFRTHMPNNNATTFIHPSNSPPVGSLRASLAASSCLQNTFKSGFVPSGSDERTGWVRRWKEDVLGRRGFRVGGAEERESRPSTVPSRDKDNISIQDSSRAGEEGKKELTDNDIHPPYPLPEIDPSELRLCSRPSTSSAPPTPGRISRSKSIHD